MLRANQYLEVMDLDERNYLKRIDKYKYKQEIVEEVIQLLSIDKDSDPDLVNEFLDGDYSFSFTMSRGRFLLTVKRDEETVKIGIKPNFETGDPQLRTISRFFQQFFISRIESEQRQLKKHLAERAQDIFDSGKKK
jgi:hypothetical protein